MVHANYSADGSPAHYFEVQTLVLLDDDWIFAPQYRLKDSSLKDSRDSARNLNQQYVECNLSRHTRTILSVNLKIEKINSSAQIMAIALTPSNFIQKYQSDLDINIKEKEKHL